MVVDNNQMMSDDDLSLDLLIHEHFVLFGVQKMGERHCEGEGECWCGLNRMWLVVEWHGVQ